MNNLQDILLFPVRDAEARKQFLIACLVMLAAFVIPLLPALVFMGYGIKVMRQIVDERKSPSMPSWQGIEWSETFLDGIKLYGVQLVLMLPLFALMGCGFLAMIGGSLTMSLLMEESTRFIAPVGGVFFFIGISAMMLLSLLSLPYSIIISAAGPHVATRRTFAAGFEFKEWWAVFRKAAGQFIFAYVLTFAVSFIFVFIMQIALITIVLMCVVPFLMIPYSVYSMLISNALLAQAYAVGSDALAKENHATA
jgi:hypothetical protein